MAGKGSKPGEKRGGRKKGVPNKLNIQTRAALLAHCKTEGVDPFMVMVQFLKHRDVKVRLAAATELADRLLPKLKSIELTGDPDRPMHLITGHVTATERAARIVRIAILEAKRVAHVDHS